MEKVSVIVAVYNVEDYLEKCLNSIINQTYKNIEIICINDCSIDSSLEILNKYSQIDSRIIIINNPHNLGVASVRNIGLKIATGDYICNIDPDDWVEPDYIECFIKAALKTRANVIVNTNIDVHYGTTKTELMPDKTYNKANNVYINAKEAIYNIIWSACSHFYKKSFLLDINASYPDGYSIEDVYFQAVVYLNIDTVYVIRESCYHYVIRNGSITTTPNKISRVIDSLDLVYDYLLANNFHEKYGIRLLFDHILYPHNEEEINKLSQYLSRIKDYILKHKNLYTVQELEILEKYTTNKNTKVS